MGAKLQESLVITNEFVTMNSVTDVRQLLFDIHGITIFVYGVLDNFTKSDNPTEYIRTRPEAILELIEKVHNETLEIFKKKARTLLHASGISSVRDEDNIRGNEFARSRT